MEKLLSLLQGGSPGGRAGSVNLTHCRFDYLTSSVTSALFSTEATEPRSNSIFTLSATFTRMVLSLTLATMP